MGKMKKTSMDVRITHPNAPSNISTPVDKLLLIRNETEKRTKYVSRIISTQRGSFIPLVLTTSATTVDIVEYHSKNIMMFALKKTEQGNLDYKVRDSVMSF